MKDYSYISNADPEYIDNLYEKYMENPESIGDGWKLFFEGFDFFSSASANGKAVSSQITSADELSVFAIIQGFRERGHLLSKTNPIRHRIDRKPHLNLADYNLSEEDLDRHFVAGEEIGLENATLREIIARLEDIYTRHIGFEFSHIEDRKRRTWLRRRIEERTMKEDFDLSPEQKKRILEKLNDATIFEQFLHTKFIGQKRFSLEGGETAIAALDAIIHYCAEKEVKEFIIGMAHRGRLNVLANVMGKTYEQIFSEFEGTALPNQGMGGGDVKYHLGYSSQIKVKDKYNVDLKLVPNPSHLEAVDTVVEGFSRAKADILYDSQYDKIMPILFHGDAAFAAQGVVYETAQMSRLDGFYTGGTIHYVINNQIGFTTDFVDGRSSTYCSDVAKVVQAPVFHVNGDDPEAAVFAAELAVEYRQKFNSDVYIDMVCYRKHGHNEGDDPKYTQPEMYELIKNHPSPREIYKNILVERGDIDADMAQKLEESFWNDLQERLDMVQQERLPYEYQEPELAWKRLKKTTEEKDFEVSPVTGIKEENFRKVINHLLFVPDDFHLVPKFHRLFKNMRELIENNTYNWGFAELVAYGSLLLEGHDVRMSGQDSERGTFSHRHAILYDKNTEAEYNRLNGMTDDQGRFMIYNSLLSEYGVLGFEFGYSMASPDSLILWEAQFGDFANGAQIMIDEFVASSEVKWQRMSGLTMLLPHGYEGQGPDHSSARLERFLHLCADFNITVANITTPANFFHALRRQLNRPFRKPLVVMSPKSLLRHPKCVSPDSDFFGDTRFQEVLDDENFSTMKAAGKVERLILCSGKVYYDLLEEREKEELKNVALVRIEQLYPLPRKQIDTIIKKYKDAALYWVQEEPANMGANWYMKISLEDVPLTSISRDPSSSPATGHKSVHVERQKQLVRKALGIG